ncbi:MAG: proline--tRNA ligase [Flavobacteriaceae bacterium]|nr:proline--tRNA ligase [Flavobacteriaceae bacterium]
MSKSLTPRSQDYSKWYHDLIVKANLAENSAVRGCMIIKPNGFSIWEKMQAQLDEMFKATGHQNAYFPLFVPKSLFEAEEKNAEGFAKECAIVTHYRLKNNPTTKGKLMVDPESKLEEELIVRPTSEAIIWNTYKNWIQSYRDLPILLNQWSNVVRWEMRTRLFLRTSEFLWQEGHTAHASKQEALKEAQLMNEIYADFAENYMAIPVLQGTKSESEKFAGAEITYCIEALMQDGKALQAGTSHFLGQNFAKAFDVKFATKSGTLDYVWATSWGVSTRLMGALVMTHGDDQGLVLPPNLAPIQIVIIPIYKNQEELQRISELANQMVDQFSSKQYRIKYDDRKNQKPGFKFHQYELEGVPLRISLGPRDLEKNQVEISYRLTLEKELIPVDQLIPYVEKKLSSMQKEMFQKALKFQRDNTFEANSFDTFQDILNQKGGFVLAHWDGREETEKEIQAKTKASIRCIPKNQTVEKGTCILSGKPSNGRVVFARAY